MVPLDHAPLGWLPVGIFKSFVLSGSPDGPVGERVGVHLVLLVNHPHGAAVRVDAAWSGVPGSEWEALRGGVYLGLLVVGVDDPPRVRVIHGPQGGAVGPDAAYLPGHFRQGKVPLHRPHQQLRSDLGPVGEGAIE